ncbi:ABC transporter [Alcanivorax sp. P2S70]|uniref:MlaA family lipoprotein n=1 Tax=Alcanivorax sp. P2S70 TaxID=1397527 RepID=UPI0003B4CD20|nr:VacJ family lipoprotein [Alcanivorax sp. P2S70]ERP86666.1 ABC transporter [Alcanivorax sp. P2S70]
MAKPPVTGVFVRYLLLTILLSLPVLVTAEEEDDWGEATTAFDAPAGQNQYADPWENMNRKVFAFNEFLDTYGLKPVAKGYQKATPQWMDDTITRFYENLRDFRSGLNSVLQWRWNHVGQNWGRFAVNSTLGIGGLFDVASKVNLRKHDTDLGLTFARWGIPEGPYLVLPFFGPSTGRDAAAIWPEDYMRLRHYIDHDLTRHSFTAVYVVDLRADLLDLERTIVGDRYTFIRNAYLQRRRFESGDRPSLRFPDIEQRDLELESEYEEDGW